MNLGQLFFISSFAMKKNEKGILPNSFIVDFPRKRIYATDGLVILRIKYSDLKPHKEHRWVETYKMTKRNCLYEKELKATPAVLDSFWFASEPQVPIEKLDDVVDRCMASNMACRNPKPAFIDSAHLFLIERLTKVFGIGLNAYYGEVDKPILFLWEPTNWCPYQIEVVISPVRYVIRNLPKKGAKNEQNATDK